MTMPVISRIGAPARWPQRVICRWLGHRWGARRTGFYVESWKPPAAMQGVVKLWSRRCDRCWASEEWFR